MFGHKMASIGREKMNTSPSEGAITKTVERATGNLPSMLFLTFAGASILGALGLRATGRKNDAQFVGQWAPTFLLLGIYNKLVKTTGHD